MTAPLAVVVTGSRDWTDGVPIAEALARVHRKGRAVPGGFPGVPMVLIHGDCGRFGEGGRIVRGADLFAAERAKAWGWGVIPMPALWSKYGTRAGTVRNNDMLTVLGALRAVGYDCLVLAFPLPHSKGTRHCMRLAAKLGFEVRDCGKGST